MSRKTFTQYSSETAIFFFFIRCAHPVCSHSTSRSSSETPSKKREEKNRKFLCHILDYYRFASSFHTQRNQCCAFRIFFFFVFVKLFELVAACVDAWHRLSLHAGSQRMWEIIRRNAANGIATVSNKKSTTHFSIIQRIKYVFTLIFLLVRYTLSIVNRLKSAGTQHIINPCKIGKWKSSKCNSRSCCTLIDNTRSYMLLSCAASIPDRLR